ncbi:MAG: ribosomal protein S18-alanine N-acetyltransferase [Acidobacteriota bacterium]|nr:ribosomal protein S18-alanine N-acetyltransferase [Acidobacteriota bacterium]
MLSIRRARPTDLPSILRIEKKSFAHDAWDRENFAGYFAQSKRTVFLVAHVRCSVVGYALAYHSLTRAEIDSIAVAPSKRGHGIAPALLTRLLASLRRRGFPAVSLRVRLDNLTAIRLYQKLGFARIRRVNNYYDDGAPALRMRRIL